MLIKCKILLAFTVFTNTYLEKNLSLLYELVVEGCIEAGSEIHDSRAALLSAQHHFSFLTDHVTSKSFAKDIKGKQALGFL